MDGNHIPVQATEAPSHLGGPTVWSVGTHAAEIAKLRREAQEDLKQQVLDAVRSMPLGYRPQDVADELEHHDFAQPEGM
jgi:hypothetical protein